MNKASLLLGAWSALLLLAGGCTLPGTGTLRPATAANEAPAEAPAAPPVSVRLLTPRYTRDLDRLPAFYVSVVAQGPAPLALSLHDITAFSGPAPVRLYRPDELAGKIVRATRFASFAAEARGKAEQRVAISWEKAPGRTLLISAELATFENVSTSQRTGVRQLKDVNSMLSMRIIQPGATGGGTIKLHAEDIRRGPPLRLVVTLAGTPHTFVFETTAAASPDTPAPPT